MNFFQWFLSTTNWAALSAVATAIMAFFTYKALLQSKEQEKRRLRIVLF